MKIIQAGPFPIDSNIIKGGVESSIHGISYALAKNNDVLVIDYPRFELKSDIIENKEDFQVYRFKSSYKNNNSNILRLFTILKVINQYKPDVCHLHTTSILSLILYISLKINKIPVVLTVHGLAYIEKMNLLRKNNNIKNYIKFITHSFAEFLLLSISKQVIVDTKYVSNSIEEYKNKNKIFRLPEIFVIPQGVNDLYYKLKCDIDSQNILAVGSINPRKGHIELIHSMKLLIDEYPNIFLNIIGVVSDTNYLKEITNKISELGLTAKVKVHTNLKFEELIEFYKKSSLFALHTQEESQGIVFCEAMACGMPILTTKVGGIPFVVDHNKGGYLNEFNDIVSFTQNIGFLLSDKDLRKKFSKYNLSKAVQYQWSNIAINIIEVYKLIITK